MDTLSRWLSSVLWFNWMTGGCWFWGTDKLLTENSGCLVPSHEKSVSKKSWFLPHPHWEREHETWLWEWKWLLGCSQQLSIILGIGRKTLPLYEQLPASPKRHLSSPENMDTILSGICCSRLWESLVKHPVKWLQSSMGLADLSVSYQPQPAASLGQMLDARIWARAIATLFSQNQAGDGGAGRLCF